MFCNYSEATFRAPVAKQSAGRRPPVWRRLLILEQVTIVLLHHVIQLEKGFDDEHLNQFITHGWCYGGHRDDALQFFAGPKALSLAAAGWREHGRVAYVYDFTAWCRRTW
jgi:hypothetical protein